jgi:predicted nucleic acid-binding protein
MQLMLKYQDQPMDLADASLVRMSELETDCEVFTVDRNDFQVYRRFGRQEIPIIAPPARP